MEIILFIIIASLLFPGSSKGGGFELVMIPVFITCAALVLAFFAAITYAAIAVAEATSIEWLGIATWLALLIGTGVGNRLVCDLIDARADAQSPKPSM